jgi:hypothetical protein
MRVIHHHKLEFFTPHTGSPGSFAPKQVAFRRSPTGNRAIRITSRHQPHSPFLTTSAVLAGLEQRFDFIVSPEERDKQVRWPVLKDEAQRNIAATLENLRAQFTNPQATMHMRATKGLGQLAQR